METPTTQSQFDRKLNVNDRYEKLYINDKPYSINQLNYFISNCINQIVSSYHSQSNYFFCEDIDHNGRLVIYDFKSIVLKLYRNELMLFKMIDFMSNKSILHLNNYTIKNRLTNKYFNNELYDKYFSECENVEDITNIKRIRIITTKEYEFLKQITPIDRRIIKLLTKEEERTESYSAFGYSCEDCVIVKKSLFNNKNKMNIQHIQKLLKSIDYQKNYSDYMKTTQTEEEQECMIDSD